MAITQATTVVTLLVVFKRLFAVVSNQKVVILGTIGWLLIGLLFPIANFTARHVQQDDVNEWVLYAVLGLWVVGRPVGLLWNA
jgi:hypothetical protein